MDQTTLPRPSAQPALYDLLARCWPTESAVTAHCFDRNMTTVAFALADGRVALVPLADPEPPEKRIRQELDTGRSAIRPRAKAVPPPTFTEALDDGAVRLAPSNTHGFLVAGRHGQIFRVTPRGQVLRLLKGTQPVIALASDGQGRFAIAQERGIVLHDEADLVPFQALPTHCRPDGLTFLPQSRRLAIAGEQALFLWQPGSPPESHAVQAAAPIICAHDESWIGGASRDGGLWLMQLVTGRVTVIGNFRAPPRSVCFSGKAGAVFAAGAFRIAGWSLSDAPFDSDATGALRSGRPGLVLTEAVAAHPTRDLVAAGLADGAVVVAQAGRPDEMMLRHAAGAAVTTLGWSADGTHLAISTADGELAIVTFPPHLFK